MMSASFQVWPGYLQTAASSTSILQVGTQTLGVSTEARECRFTCLWGMPFLTAWQFCPFFPGSNQSDKSNNLK
jgi:hypothetical protein